MASANPRYSRRGIIALALVAGLAWATRRLLPSVSIEEANDFPVNNFGPEFATLDPATWQLAVTGEVEQPFSLTYADILRMPRERHRYPLDCITGWSATRDWEGVPITKLLAMAHPKAPDSLLLFISSTGYEVRMPARRYTQPGALLATHVGGAPFTRDHGFPLRLMVPGVVGEENVKWLKEIRVLA